MDRHKLAALLAERAKQNGAVGGVTAIAKAPMQSPLAPKPPMSTMQGPPATQQPVSNLGSPQIQPKAAMPISPVQKALLPPVSTNANFGRLKQMIQGPKAPAGLSQGPQQQVIKAARPKKPQPI